MYKAILSFNGLWIDSDILKSASWALGLQEHFGLWSVLAASAVGNA